MRYIPQICEVCKSPKTVKRALLDFPRSIWPSRAKIPCDDVCYTICRCCGYAVSDIARSVDVTELYNFEQFVLPDVSVVRERCTELVEKFDIREDSAIIDFGGGHNNFAALGFSNITVIDYVRPENKNIRYLDAKDFFDGPAEIKASCVVCYHTLEHLDNPALVLDRMRTVLTDRGLLCVEVPNAERVAVANPTYLFFSQHISIYTRESLIRQVTDAGFQLEYDGSDSTYLRMYFRKNSESHKIRHHKLSSAPSYLATYLDGVGSRIDSILRLIREYKFIQMLSGGSTVCLLYYLGRHGKSEWLSNIRLFDSNPAKHGLRCFSGHEVSSINKISSDYPLVLIGKPQGDLRIATSKNIPLKIEYIL